LTIRSSEYFTFNNRRSDEFPIYNVNLQSNLQAEPFAAGRSIKERKIRGNDRPYFMGVELEPLEFTVSFGFLEPWNEQTIRETARWLLSPPYYAPLAFAEDLDRIYYCLCVDVPELVHNGLSQGYINLKFRCADAYTYSRVYEDIHDLTDNPAEGTAISFHNLGDAPCKPLISILKKGSGDVSIFNRSNGNAEFTLKNLQDGETVVVDCENRTIDTDLPLTFRYGDLVGDYTVLPVYRNDLLVKGRCELKFTYQWRRIQ